MSLFGLKLKSFIMIRLVNLMLVAVIATSDLQGTEQEIGRQ